MLSCGGIELVKFSLAVSPTFMSARASSCWPGCIGSARQICSMPVS
jgi:hypothetical protein